MTKYVVDVSRWQGKMNWARAANAGCVVGIARATMGLPSVNYTGVDEQFFNNWDGMEAEGLDRGAYHLFLPELDGPAQAQSFVGVVQDRPRYAVVDVELNKKAIYRTVFWERLLAWCIHVDGVWPIEVGTPDEYEGDQRRTTRVVVYTRGTFWTPQLGSVPWPLGKLWQAYYTTGPKPAPIASWPDGWWLWQYSADGNKRGGEFGCESWDVDLSRAAFRL